LRIILVCIKLAIFHGPETKVNRFEPTLIGATQ